MSQRVRYRFLKYETIDQLENVFVFDLETYNGQEVPEAFAAGLHDVNRLEDRWDRSLTREEMEIERKYVIVFVKSCENCLMEMLKFVSENYEDHERT